VPGIDDIISYATGLKPNKSFDIDCAISFNDLIGFKHQSILSKSILNSAGEKYRENTVYKYATAIVVSEFSLRFK
jgi:hypothetical protein